MAHNLHIQLDDLRQRFARMTARVLQSAERSVEAVFRGDEPLISKIRNSDQRIDAEEVEVERAAIDLLALHQPAAVDLRTITTIIKANSDFERIADCAVNVASAARPLVAARGAGGLSECDPPPGLRVLADAVLEQLAATIRAFNLSDVSAAGEVLRGDARIDALYAEVLQAILSRLPEDARRHEQIVRQDVGMMTIAKNLERIGDHCTNVAEDVIYIDSGQIIRHAHSRAVDN